MELTTSGNTHRTTPSITKLSQHMALLRLTISSLIYIHRILLSWFKSRLILPDAARLHASLSSLQLQ